MLVIEECIGLFPDHRQRLTYIHKDSFTADHGNSTLTDHNPHVILYRRSLTQIYVFALGDA